MRLALAIVFIVAGYAKLTVMGVDNFAEMMQLPGFIAWLVVLGELGAGLGILAGALIAKQDEKGMLTRLSGGIIALIMVGAIVLVKMKGFDDGFVAGISGMQADIALLALGLNFAFMGNTGGDCGMCSK